jgi:hypothetical protein
MDNCHFNDITKLKKKKTIVRIINRFHKNLKASKMFNKYFSNFIGFHHCMFPIKMIVKNSL